MRLCLVRFLPIFSLLAFLVSACDGNDSKFSTVSSKGAVEEEGSADALGGEMQSDNLGGSGDSEEETFSSKVKEEMPSESMMGQSSSHEEEQEEKEIVLSTSDSAYIVLAESRIPPIPKRVHDFMFVVDNSVSMDAVLDKMKKGFSTLSKSAFPEGSKIAFMTSNAAHGNNIHPEFNDYQGINYEPGFLKPVTGQDIERFVENSAVLSSVRNKYTIKEGCDGWFAPSALTKGGSTCFAAHSQISLTPTYVEPLSYAFMQYMERHGANAFRPNADVHVIFVTDTQYIGVHKAAGEDLWEKSPKNYGEIKEGITIFGLGVDSLTMHAIAPTEEKKGTCSEPWISNNYTFDGKPYYNVIAEQSGGISIDVCSATNYETILSKIAVSAAKKKIEIELTQADLTKDDLIVKVNGEAISTFIFSDGIVTLWVDGESASQIVVEAKK